MICLGFQIPWGWQLVARARALASLCPREGTALVEAFRGSQPFPGWKSPRLSFIPMHKSLFHIICINTFLPRVNLFSLVKLLYYRKQIVTLKNIIGKIETIK